MQAFEYASPATVADAVKLLAGRDNSAALAGGTDLLDRIKDYVTTPSLVVYIKGVKELSGIRESGGSLVIGANTLLREIAGVARGTSAAQAALAEAASQVGTPQIRNMATLGGNLLQRPRCWYFRNGFGLSGGRKDGSNQIVRELEGEFAPIDVDAKTHLVRDGDNRYGPIFLTNGDALFVNTSSLAPPLIALGAKATIVGPKGERTIDVSELYIVPESPKQLELTIQPGEVLTKVTVPISDAKASTYEVRQKQAHDWPLVLCSVRLDMNGSTVRKASVVLGSVAPIPFRCEAAEQAITGKAVTFETAEAAGKAATANAKPLSMNAYKVKLTQTAVKRALLSAMGNRYWEA